MSRHSKHSNDRGFYSYNERKSAGYAFTKKEVMGTDCFLPFGSCALTLKAAKDPVATPGGWIYEREAILESLLQQKLEIAADKKKFAEQENRKTAKEESASRAEEIREINDFKAADQGLFSQDSRHKRALDNAAEEAAEKKLRMGGRELVRIDKDEFTKHVFWANQQTPSAAPAELKKPEDPVPKCPMSGKRLRVKDLIPVKFEVLDHAMHKAGGGLGVYCCAISKNAITHQQAVLLKPSGVVVLESYLKDCVLKDMQCPISGKKLKGKEDIINLQKGGTGFSAHNEIEATLFNGIRSFFGDSKARGGHVPNAGYTGLV